MPDVVQRHSGRVAAYVLVLFYVNRWRRNRKRWKNRLNIWTKPYIRRNPSLEAYSHCCSIFVCLFFCVLVCWRRNVPKSGQLWIYSINRNVCSRPSSLCQFGKCHANHVNRARVFIGWQLPTHVCQSFTHQIRVYQHEKVGEKVGENRGKFYLSPTVCQRVCRLFLSRSRTPTWVCQHQFTNFSLPCEGRFRLGDMLLIYLIRRFVV